MKEDTINEIIAIAIDSYRKQTTPGDFATLVAAAKFHIEVTQAINFSSKIADSAVSKVDANNNYDALWEKFSTTIIPKQFSENYFFNLAESPNKISQAFTEAVAPSYESTSVLNVAAKNKAKRAAEYVYATTYAIARASYVKATFLATQQSGYAKQDAFIYSITTNLRRDLNYDIVNPFLFIKLLNAIIFKVLVSTLLLAAIAGIFIAAFHVFPIPFIPLICAASGGTVVSVGLLTGSFFATNKYNEIMHENANRAEMANIV